MRKLDLYVAALVVMGTCLLGGLTIAGENPDYVISFDPAEIDIRNTEGGTFTVIVVMDNSEGEDTEGWQWGVCHDSDYFEDLTVDGPDTVPLDFADLDTTFAALSYFPGDGWNCGGLMNVITQAKLAPDVYDAYETTYTVKADVEADTTTTLDFCALGSPLVDVAIIVDKDITPVQESATINVLPPPMDPFLRGDVDSNGSVEPLIDAMATLSWGFLGGDVPECLDAADFDDNGRVHPLLDTILFIDWAFNGAEMGPAEPVDDCDSDPTDDDITCDELSDLCGGV